MASCSACKKVKSDISGPVVSIFFFFFNMSAAYRFRSSAF